MKAAAANMPVRFKSGIMYSYVEAATVEAPRFGVPESVRVADIGVASVLFLCKGAAPVFI